MRLIEISDMIHNNLGKRTIRLHLALCMADTTEREEIRAVADVELIVIAPFDILVIAVGGFHGLGMFWMARFTCFS